MSTEHIVNRVESQFNIEAEKAKLSPEETAEIPEKVGEPDLAVDLLQYGTPNSNSKKGFDTDKLLEQNPETLNSAWKDLTSTGSSDIYKHSQGLEPTDTLNQLRALVGGDDLKVFRSQVIKALKHIGVDTKRFFGE
jgi:hypothetical protein